LSNAAFNPLMVAGHVAARQRAPVR